MIVTRGRDEHPGQDAAAATVALWVAVAAGLLLAAVSLFWGLGGPGWDPLFLLWGLLWGLALSVALRSASRN